MLLEQGRLVTRLELPHETEHGFALGDRFQTGVFSKGRLAAPAAYGRPGSGRPAPGRPLQRPLRPDRFFDRQLEDRDPMGRPQPNPFYALNFAGDLDHLVVQALDKDFNLAALGLGCARSQYPDRSIK